MATKTCVIIGSGLIGQQWAMLFASSNFRVILYDISAKQINDAEVKLLESLKKFASENICRNSNDTELQHNRISYTSDFNQIPKNAEFVMECVPENLELKLSTFAKLDTFFDCDTIRMSSSSYMPISKFTSDLVNRQRCIVAHPVNPPYFLKLVELVPAPYTDESTIEKVKWLMERIGQVTIVLKKEVEGFALNRIQAAVYNSAFNLLKNEIVSVEDIDKILTEGLAPRWTFFGPMLISVINGPGAENYFSKYLSSLDSANEAQGYPPQHNERIIETIVEGMKKYDQEMVKKIFENRDSYLGMILKMKEQSKE